jgi:hypothetical protein
MDLLREALPIIERLYARGHGLNFRVSEEHICDHDHPIGECPHHKTAIYTRLDAMLDSAKALEERLRSGGSLKPPPGRVRR